MNKRLQEINARMQEIRSSLEGADAEQLTALEAEITQLEEERSLIQRREQAADKIGNGEVTGRNLPKPGLQAGAAAPENEQRSAYDSVEYRNAFMAYILRNQPIPMEMRTDAVTATSDVGAVIPTTIVQKIFEKIESYGNLFAKVTKTNYKGGVGVPLSTVKPVASWVAEGSGSDKQKKTVTNIVFGYYKLRCAVAVTLEADTTTLAIFESTLIRNISEAMIKALEIAIMSGTGVGQPQGILTHDVIADQIVSANPSYNALVDAEAALPEGYENTAIYIMSKKTFAEFLRLVDSNGQPIARVDHGIGGKPERSLLGRTVELTAAAPAYSAVATGSTYAMIVDPTDYILNTNYSMTIKKYEDNDTDDQITKAIMLADGKLVDNNSLVVLRKVAVGG